MVTLFTAIFALSLGVSMATDARPNPLTQIYAQNENETSEQGMKKMSNVTAAPGKIPSMSTPGE